MVIIVRFHNPKKNSNYKNSTTEAEVLVGSYCFQKSRKSFKYFENV